MRVDMVAHVEGLPKLTQSSLGVCSRRSVTTWSALTLSERHPTALSGFVAVTGVALA